MVGESGGLFDAFARERLLPRCSRASMMRRFLFAGVCLAMAVFWRTAPAQDLADAPGEACGETVDSPMPAEFAIAAVQSVHLDLVQAQLIDRQQIACFKSEKAWFVARGIAWDSALEGECQRRMNALRSIVAHNLPKMRQALALQSVVGSDGGSADLGYAWPLSKSQVDDLIARAPWVLDRFLTRDIAHLRAGTIGLSPLSPDEIRVAIAELNRHLDEFKVNWSNEGHAAVPPETTLYEAANYQYFADVRAQFRAKYLQILGANPILGLLSEERPSDADLQAALEILARRAEGRLSQHRALFYREVHGNGASGHDYALDEGRLTLDRVAKLQVYSASIDRLVRASNGKYCSAAAQLKRHSFWPVAVESGAVVVGMVAGTLACAVVANRVMLSKWFSRICVPAALTLPAMPQAIEAWV